jgi:hypothetical protein
MCVDPFPVEMRAAVLERAEAADAAGGGTSPQAPGNGLAVATRDELDGIPWALLDSDSELRDHAERLARRCAWAAAYAPAPSREFVGPIHPARWRLQAAERVAAGEGVDLPAEALPIGGRLARLACARWWRRRLRSHWHGRAEDAMRRFGLVHRGRAPYVTEFTRQRRRGQRRAMMDALRAAVLLNEAGQQLEMFEVWKGSVSNPAVRRTELMVRLRGFERIAADLGHVARFYTLTCPSAFHPVTTAGGEPAPNPAYQGGSVQDARAWIQRCWGRIRAKLKRLGIQVYGFRIAEPHHDGTPHWHLLLWMRPESSGLVGTVLRGYALAEYGDEPGAAKHRFKCVDIDPAKGSAVGYVAKYVAKNIDGHRVGQDGEAGGDGKRGARRVDAWAAVHRVRQFQQIGGPPVGLWRELRRLRSPVDSEPVERARSAADAGDWDGFIRALGGLENCRRGPVALWKERTGELSQYGDIRPDQVAGISGPDGRIRTRESAWRVRWNCRSRALPWTRGNNCTQGEGSNDGRQSKSAGHSPRRRKIRPRPAPSAVSRAGGDLAESRGIRDRHRPAPNGG